MRGRPAVGLRPAAARSSAPAGSARAVEPCLPSYPPHLQASICWSYRRCYACACSRKASEAWSWQALTRLQELRHRQCVKTQRVQGKEASGLVTRQRISPYTAVYMGEVVTYLPSFCSQASSCSRSYLDSIHVLTQVLRAESPGNASVMILNSAHVLWGIRSIRTLASAPTN